MNRKLAIFAAAGLAVALAVLAWVMREDGPRPAPPPPPRPAASATPSGPGAGFEPVGAPGSSAPTGAPALTGKEQQAVKEALERSARESGERQALFAGVEKPWPLPDARDALASCVKFAKDQVKPGDPVSREDACSCVVRSLQRTYPATPPDMRTRAARKGYGRNYREAMEQCLGR